MAAEAETQAAAVMEQLQRVGARVFFEKQLTSSDVSASGRVVVPKVRSPAFGRRRCAPRADGRPPRSAHDARPALGARRRRLRCTPRSRARPLPPASCLCSAGLPGGCRDLLPAPGGAHGYDPERRGRRRRRAPPQVAVRCGGGGGERACGRLGAAVERRPPAAQAARGGARPPYPSLRRPGFGSTTRAACTCWRAPRRCSTGTT
jgi:hypothetical protein